MSPLAAVDCHAAWDALRWRTLDFAAEARLAAGARDVRLEAPNDFARLGGGHLRSTFDGSEYQVARRAGRVITWRSSGSSLWLAELDVTGTRVWGSG